MTTVQARNGGIKLARKVAEADIARWKELRGRGYTFERIGSEVGWASETIRKHIGGGEIGDKEGKPEPTPQTRVFQMFESGKTPVDAVVEGVATPGEVKTMWRDYHELKNLNPPEERLKKIEKWIEEAKGEVSNFWLLVANDIIGKPCPITGCGGEIRWKGSGDGIEREGFYCTNWGKDKTSCYFHIIEPYEW